MPFYHQVVAWKARTTPQELTRVYRNVASRVLRMGGVVRQIENHGERRAPFLFRSRTITSDGVRKHESAKWVSTFFDGSPDVKNELEKLLKLEENMMRLTTLRPATKMDKVASHLKYNPWVKYEP